MKYLYIYTLVVLTTLIISSEVSAQFYYGGGMKFNTNNEFKALAINGKIGKDIAEKLDLNVDIAYYLASKASWSFDFDLQYKLLNIDDKLILNPLAGINFTRTSVTNNSLSLGVSIKVPTDKYTYFIEPRWILDYGQFVFSVGAVYPTILK